eukprot:1390252-Amphidinium_carterae.1
MKPRTGARGGTWEWDDRGVGTLRGPLAGFWTGADQQISRKERNRMSNGRSSMERVDGQCQTHTRVFQK